MGGSKVKENVKPTKIVFGDEGEIVSKTKQDLKSHKDGNGDENAMHESKHIREDCDNMAEDDVSFSIKENRKSKQKTETDERKSEILSKWYYIHPQYQSSDEILEMKDNDQMELYNICRNSYNQEKAAFLKQNPPDARWLQTALHKGTAKDRANAGALLVTSNPLGNLEALSILVESTKLSNQYSAEVISIMTDLWKEVLLPPHRKLYSLQMRGADWKQVRKNTSLMKEQLREIYAYWYFENELKDQYFEFLKNVQKSVQTGQETNKTVSIMTASQLLLFSPEKEQMLLTMLVNKLGDPVGKIASKALHHLTDVAYKHPNMCEIIVKETEKLIFRNNISDRAQHFALCYLANVAHAGGPEVCTKLVHICFSLFKVLVQKGVVNSRAMQAILRCLQKSILKAKPLDNENELLSKEMQDTVYRLVHLADIRVSIQTLGLLLQLVTVRSEKSDRFYNALYTKLIDINLTTIGSKAAAQMFHIVHRSIFIDSNVPRAQAFIKRLLQFSLCTPSHMTAGCLIVIHKLFRCRKELCLKQNSSETSANCNKVLVTDEELAKFDSDGEERYEDVAENSSNDCTEDGKTFVDNIESSWDHLKISSCDNNSKVRELTPNEYKPFNRVPSYAGAEFAISYELQLLRKHFHPTVQFFASSILNYERINYYGDPLRDFGLSHFLERFSFKNPKKIEQVKTNKSIQGHKHYISYGNRNLPVKSLTKSNCSEEEMFIFNYLERKRKQSVIPKTKHCDKGDESIEGLKSADLDDDEFEEYLAGFFSKKTKRSDKTDKQYDDDLDFLKEFKGTLTADSKQNKTKRKKGATVEEDVDADWDENDCKADFATDGELEDEDEFHEDDDDVSESMDNYESNEDLENESGNDDYYSDDNEPRHKKSKTFSLSEINERSFAEKLKHSYDMSSLFTAADDFAELLEETGKTKGHGTLNAVFNADKSSEKQLKWEQQRRSNIKTFKNNTKGSILKRR